MPDAMRALVRGQSSQKEPQFVGWDAGTIAAGASATSTLTLKGIKPGSAYVYGAALAQNAAIETCESRDFNACDQEARTLIKVVPAPKPTAPSHAPADNGSAPISNTGAPVLQLAALALLALLVGLALAWAGIERRHGRHCA